MLQFAGGKCSVHQALLHCQPRLFHLGNAPTCQYKDSTQALFSYKSTSSRKSTQLTGIEPVTKGDDSSILARPARLRTV